MNHIHIYLDSYDFLEPFCTRCGWSRKLVRPGGGYLSLTDLAQLSQHSCNERTTNNA